MGLCLIAETSVLEYLWVIFQVAAGLGMVIFVHELGHFLVAKACGVQCDKFYVGFDPPLTLPFIGKLINLIGAPLKLPSVPDPIRLPSALFKRKWGETEYGIGIIPLGGYVKMLGQDDNPTKAAEEMRRAREYKERTAEGADAAIPPGESAASARPDEVLAAATTLGDVPEEPHRHAEGEEEEYTLNPRSYLAKNVPQRMAIISAGVIMNVIFAFIFATWAYSLGVKYTPCIISDVVPGSPAADAGLKVGAEIVQVGDLVKPQFRDLQQEVMLGDLKNGVALYVKDPGEELATKVVLVPSSKTSLPTIGIRPAESLTLSQELPTFKGSPAEAAGFQGGDEVVAVDGHLIASYRELQAILAANSENTLDMTVLRGGTLGESNAPGERKGGEKIPLKVQPNPMKRLGLDMRIGQITNVQADSPAAKADLRPGDFIERLNDQPLGDPITLPDRLRDLAVERVPAMLRITRDNNTFDVTIPLRVPSWYDTPMIGSPMSAPALGIGYRVLNSVLRVYPQGAAAKAKPYGAKAEAIGPGLVAQDTILSAEFLFPEEEGEEPYALKELFDNKIEFSDEKSNWPGFISRLQDIPPGMKVRLTVLRGKEELQFELTPQLDSEYFDPARGFIFAPLQLIRRADTLSEAAQLGYRETKFAMGAVYRFLQKLGHQIPLTALGGPITIAQGAGMSAFHGFSSLLIFLTLLSANLAVVNFLPIPLLDGGHMVLLILEGVMRRPVSEKIVGAFQMLGFVFILGLMLFVLTLDVGRLAGHFGL